MAAERWERDVDVEIMVIGMMFRYYGVLNEISLDQEVETAINIFDIYPIWLSGIREAVSHGT